LIATHVDPAQQTVRYEGQQHGALAASSMEVDAGQRVHFDPATRIESVIRTCGFRIRVGDSIFVVLARGRTSTEWMAGVSRGVVRSRVLGPMILRVLDEHPGASQALQQRQHEQR
jgi:hypothetical protein